jgi:hypothetical protein
MPSIAKSATYKVDLQRSKDEILELKSQADDSGIPEDSIIASTIDWLFDREAETPLSTITDSDEDIDEPDIEDFEDDEDDGEEFDDDDIEGEILPLVR